MPTMPAAGHSGEAEAEAAPASSEPQTSHVQTRLTPLPPFQPDLYQRAWVSVPHPTLPLLATAHSNVVTVFSLSTLSAHSQLTGGHERSVRAAAWKPGLPPHSLCLATGSFDSTAALWRWDDADKAAHALEADVSAVRARGAHAHANDDDRDDDAWEFTLVLEGQEHEIKGVSFSPSGQYLATCSRDKSVWIWEDVGAAEDEDEWETLAVLNEHEGDVKAVAWCPDVPGRSSRGRYGADVLASSSYDNTVRIWREDGDGEWVCVSVLEGHEGIVWGVQWEPCPTNTNFPRLMTWSSDRTIRIWTLREPKERDEGPQDDESGPATASGPFFRTGLGGIPNTMRRSLREDWDCTACLPTAHTRQVYSATWSPVTGRVASTGGDGIIAIYAESTESTTDATGAPEGELVPNGDPPASACWQLLTTVPNAHGPYEVNHVTWCRRFDAASENRGIEEMLVTTGDDGIVRPWQVTS